VLPPMSIFFASFLKKRKFFVEERDLCKWGGGGVRKDAQKRRNVPPKGSVIELADKREGVDSKRKRD